jgi:hypothetical protein
MPRSLAKSILKILASAGWDKRPSPSPWHTRVLTSLGQVVNEANLLDAFVDLEGLVGAYVTSELSHYRPTARIADQEDRRRVIYDHAQTLFAAYRVLTPVARKMVAAGGPDMVTVASLITLDGGSTGGNKKAAAFLQEVDGFVIVSLLLGTRAPIGQRLVTKLAQAHAALSLRIVYKESPSSLLAFAGGGGAFCGAGAASVLPGLRERAKPIAKGAGGPSQMGAPVWFDDGKSSAGELQAASFGKQSVDEALSKILMGSVSFTRDRVPFFTPARVEILHELIHVLHNARGSNREAVKGALNDAETGAWHNAEEYWTIAGGNITENEFNATIGAPDRHGHGGLPLSGLDPASELAQYTMVQHAGF